MILLMKWRTWMVLILILACVLCWSVFYGSERTIDNIVHERTGRTGAKTLRPSRFMYLLQTESCLPDHLGLVKAIGNANACQCDVLVLSYKQICSVTPPPHIEYLFNSSQITWTTGRNLLFEVARQRGEKYLYYIFMDDDVILEPIRTNKVKNCWREFEDFLKRIEPAIAAADVAHMGLGVNLKLLYEAREYQGCKDSLKEELTEYLTAVRFDAAFNAFHYQAVEHILPYSASFDEISWWHSQVYNEIKCEILFQGQVVLHTKICANNPKHRPYRRKLPSDTDMLAMLNEIEAELPEEYKNSSLLLGWKKDGLNHAKISSTYCLPPPPPHMPIKHIRGKPFNSPSSVPNRERKVAK